jgi:hypothetical protein
VKASTSLRRAAVLVLVALLAAACEGSKQAAPTATTAAVAGGEEGAEAGDPVEAILTVKPATGVVAERGFSTGPIASTGTHLFWEAARDQEGGDVFLVGRNLPTRETRVLAHNLSPLFGLASTSDSLVFATHGSAGTDLVTTDLSGSHRRVLSDSLAAPFDARGDIVAWAEQIGARQRVVTLNLRTGRRLVVLDEARCRRGRCYRIDRVTVARDGVAFDLGSVGQGYPSLVARRSWSGARTELTPVPHDPQPDLARSAEGALYYQLRRGWFEWKFGEDRPRAIAGAKTWLLEAQGGRRLVLKGEACSAGVGVVDSSGRVTPLPAPRSSPASPTQFGPLCRQLTGLVWSGSRLLIGWSFTPKVSLQGHTDVGLSGLITTLRLP